MPTDKTLLSRIPFEDIKTVTSWQLPNLGKNAKVIPSVKKEDNKRDPRKPRGKETIEDLPDAKVAQLTAEQLKNLTERAEKEAREEGYKNGFEEGMKQGEKKGEQLGEQKAYRETKAALEEQTEAFAALADALFQPVTDHNASLENTVINMAVELAKHFIHTELTLNPSLMFPSVEQAVAGLPAGSKQISVSVHPADLAHIEDAFANKKGHWQFLPDAKMTRGGCKVESHVSTVDFTFERRIHDWKRAIQGGGVPDEPIPATTDYRPNKAETPVPEASAPPEDANVESAPADYQDAAQTSPEGNNANSEFDEVRSPSEPAPYAPEDPVNDNPFP